MSLLTKILTKNDMRPSPKANWQKKSEPPHEASLSVKAKRHGNTKIQSRKIFFIASATLSPVKPNFLKSCSPGADAPKPVIATTAPSNPT